MGFAPQITTSCENSICIGSAASIPGYICCQAAPKVAAQILCSISGQPKRANNSTIAPELSSTPEEELYKYPKTLSTPCSVIAVLVFVAISSIASSHDAVRNCPLPLGPVRINGVVSLASECTRFTLCFTFRQIKSAVKPLISPVVAASISTMTLS